MEEIDVLGFLRKKENFIKYSPHLQERYFDSSAAREVYKILNIFFTAYPDKDMVSKRNLKLEVEIEGDEKKILYELIKSLPTKIDEDLGGKRIAEFIQQGIAKNILRENLPVLEENKKVDVELLKRGLREIEVIDVGEDTSYDYVKGVESIHQTFTTQSTIFKTGVNLLDETLRLPPMSGEEWIILGPPGRGKTQTLLNLMFHAAEQGANCLYVSAGDQGLNRMLHRLNPIMSNIPWQRLDDPSIRTAGLLRKRLRENIVSKGGEIKIQDWSDRSCCPADIEALIANNNYDFVAVDYPDIMKADKGDRYKERRHEIASIFSALRRIAVKYDLLMWCGSQANRSALDKAIITMKDVAEDIQKCWVADGIISFCQTEEEKEELMGRFFIAKARRPPLKSYEIFINIDEDTGRIL